MKWYLVITTDMARLDLSDFRVYYDTLEEANRQAEIAHHLDFVIDVEVKALPVYVVYCESGSVRHRMYEFDNYDDAWKYCEGENWVCDYNGGLIWDLVIEEEDRRRE